MTEKQILNTILSLQSQNHKATRELAEVYFTSADFPCVSRAQQLLSEQMNMLIQLREEVIAMFQSREANPSPITIPLNQPLEEKRARGGQRQYYLLDMSQRSEYVARVHSLFEQYYRPNRNFVLPDGTLVNAPLFLACLYDLGIQQGIASDEAPVKDFALLVKEAASGFPDFCTAYNTIQKVIKSWRIYIGFQCYGDRTIHLHSICPDEVKPEYRQEYQHNIAVLDKIRSLM